MQYHFEQRSLLLTPVCLSVENFFKFCCLLLLIQKRNKFHKNKIELVELFDVAVTQTWMSAKLCQMLAVTEDAKTQMEVLNVIVNLVSTMDQLSRVLVS